jgi:hypothetical protein
MVSSCLIATVPIINGSVNAGAMLSDCLIAVTGHALNYDVVIT